MTLWDGAALHLGCGTHRLPPPWVNVDGQPGPAVDLVLDLHTGLDVLPSGVLTHVYSSHTIEHLYPDLLLGVLTHCVRALRPGGKIILATTDLEGIYRHRFERPLEGDAWEAALFGQTLSTDHPFAAHRDCFTYDKLDRLLRAAGCAHVRAWTLDDYPWVRTLNDFASTDPLATVYAEGCK